jgi:hypothetical protein
MPSFLKFHNVAAMRGDGLHPEFQPLFERVAMAPSVDVIVRHDGMVQSGPNPVSAGVQNPVVAISKLPAAKIKLNHEG